MAASAGQSLRNQRRLVGQGNAAATATAKEVATMSSLVGEFDNNSDEQAAKHSKENWDKMLEGLKKVAEAS